ncbi:hypothetical protein Tco_0588342 [Tanacetum coccineum]
MVAYLQKPEGSEAFHQIVDFLNASHIKYALIKNPKIYISLIQQFWGTATARTTDDGEVEIIASIDGQVKTIIEASLRRHLKLEDSDGITSLPNTEIFEQLALMGYVSDSARLTFQKGHFSPQWRFFIHTILHSDEAAFISVDVDAGEAATTDIGLEAGQGSGTMHKTLTRPHDSPLPGVHTLGSDEGSLQQNELMDLVTKLTDRIEVLENDMQRTKKVYSSALTKLILRVKKLEKKVKTNKARRRARICDSSVPVTTASATPEVSTAAANLVYIKRSAEKRKDKGKAIMKEDESIQNKTKKQLEQERLGHEEAIRLQEQINEEENQRIARDAEITKQLQEKFNRARQEQEVVAESSKKRSREDSNEGNAKKQKLEDDAEKKELRDSMDVVLRDDIAIDAESFATKYPIGDLKILFEPNEEDEIWKNQQDYNLISKRLFDSCGIHILLMHTGIAIHMIIEKKYPITQEMLSRMLSRRLEVDQESEMAFELLMFIRSQLQK